MELGKIKGFHREHHAFLRQENLLSVLSFGAVILGILAGIVFGDRCRIFAPTGNFFIALMQASVLPYLFFSILYSFGSLDRKSLTDVWKTLLCTFFAVYVPIVLLYRFIPFSFPNWLHTPLFSIGRDAIHTEVVTISMFISNPIMAMANNYVPALALFCLIAGFILQRTPQKNVVMHVLKTSQDVLVDFSRLCGYIVPLCIFAIIANVTGCTPFSELFRYRVYMISFALMSLFLFFVMLPLLLKIFYPFRYADIFRAVRFPCMTAFLTGNPFIVLPVINESLAELFEKYNFERHKIYRYSAILIPIYYLFPGASRLADMIFIYFAAWQNNIILGRLDMLQLYIVNFLVGFGSAEVGVPFMLQYFGLPQKMFDIYMLSDFMVNLKLRSAFGTLGLFCCTAISILMLEKIRIRLKTVCINIALTVLLAAAIAVGLKIFWSTQTRTESEKKILNAMKVEKKVPWVLYRELPREARPEGPLLDQILGSRTLRVGICPAVMPSCYLDRDGNPAGLDIQLIQSLASELDCEKIEYYVIDYPDVPVMLAQRRLDIAAGHLYVTQKRLGNILFTKPYLQVPVAFMAPRDRIQFLRANPALLNSEEISVGVIDDEEISMLRRRGVKAQLCRLESYTKFIEDDTICDLMCISADVAAVYCVLHPEFDYYVSPGMYQNMIAFALPPKSFLFAYFVDYYFSILEKNGDLKKWQRYWISGENVIAAKRHWSVVDALIQSREAGVNKFEKE